MRQGVCGLSLALLLALSATGVSAQSPDIVVEALLPKTAVLKINGQRKTLRQGDSYAGVTLVAADQKSATLSINGVEQVVGMSQHISTNYSQPTEQKVTIPRDSRNQYNTMALINGRNVQVMVDTGASSVALSANHANAMGIDFYRGQPIHVETASGLTTGYEVTLRSVSVGGIEVNNVKGTVLEGAFPVTILLGMTYLRHVKMEEHNGILSLTKVP